MKEGIIMVNKIYDRYDAIAFDQKRYIRSEMKELIFKKHLYRDFTQSIYEGAIIARNSKIDLDKKNSYRLVANIVNRR